MRHHFFGASNPQYGLLIKESAFRISELKKYYTEPAKALGIPEDEFLGLTLDYAGKKTPTAKDMREYLEGLMVIVKDNGLKTLLVADSAYFKALTKVKKVTSSYGYIVPCALKGYEDINVILAINYQGLFYKPESQDKLDLSLKTLLADYKDDYVEIGTGIIKSAAYPIAYEDILNQLKIASTKPLISMDCETKSLDFYHAGIGTVGIAWSEHEGFAFPVDTHGGLGEPIRELLKTFFSEYTGTIIWHNANYDLKIMVYELWMKDPLDYAGLIEGMNTVTCNFHCTKVITYLATNSTSGNNLKLKDLAHEFAGDWAEDVTDIMQVPQADLLQYNLVDCLSTFYVFNKYYPKMIEDNQESVYQEIFHPSIKLLLQIELTGMPLDPEQVLVTEKELQAILDNQLKVFKSSPIIKAFVLDERRAARDAKNATLKTKVKPLSDFDHITFNPNSNPQLQRLLYDTLGLPEIDFTASKAPATGGKTIKKLKHHTSDPEILLILDSLIQVAEVSIILNTFISAFKNKVLGKADGRVYLHGNFNLGGTVSGRLSSSGPNLQNIPSTGSTYAKHVKRCFKAPDGWIMVGADFASLEDRISALTTKDPNKLKVYTGVKIYKVTVNGVCHHIRDDDTINFDGKSYTGEQFNDKFGTDSTV